MPNDFWFSRIPASDAPAWSPPTPMDDTAIALENARLKASWDCLPAEHLAVYLGVEEQDQRLNTHSILNRALLIDSLWPGCFDALIDEELRFGLVMTWLLQALKSGAERARLLEELDRPASGSQIPAIVRRTWHWLQSDSCPIPDYLGEALMYVDPDRPHWSLFEPAMNTFASIWSSQLSARNAKCVEVLEVACGSGNDFKALRNFGLERHISYAGFDIAWKNIRNAREIFPGVRFFEASILDSGLPDKSFDYLFVHDLLGHLSPDALEIAVGEIMRVTRCEAWLHCHNIAGIPRHEIRPFLSYFRNRLSIPQLKASLEAAGATVTVVPLSGLLRQKFDVAPEYTASAGTFLARAG